MLTALVAAALLAMGVGAAQYPEDDESYFHKYQGDDEVTRPLGEQNEHFHHRAPSSPASRTLSNEQINHIKDTLKKLLPNYDLHKAFPTIPEWKDTTTSWYTVKNILAGILKDINEEKSKADGDGPTPFKCTACNRQTLSLFGVKSKENKCTRTDTDDDEEDCIDSTNEEFDENLKCTNNEENYNNDYGTTQNWTSVVAVTIQEQIYANQIDVNTEDVYIYEMPTYWPEMEQIFDLNKLNKSQILNDIKILEKLAMDRPKRDYFDSEETTTQIKANQRVPFSLDKLKKLFEDPVVLMGQRRNLQTTRNRRRSSKRRRKTMTRSRRRRTRWLTKARPQPKVDFVKLVELITNITQDYSENLTMRVREELNRAGQPAYKDIFMENSTDISTTVASDPYSNLTGTIMGKCFVCGLTEEHLPHSASCADAFASDFIPLVQVDPSSRRQLANYRKYCRWMNVPRYIINETDPRSMWGRWTGGCSVRWIDISGIYTQRTCRNRHRAVMGKHWVSKRMAKLEMALQHTDNGCIISPMASLVPLSRGISLYARFHACVCTGSWCNQSPPSTQCTPYIVAFTTFLVMVLRTFLLEYDVRWDDVPRRKTMLFTFY